jgi:hypothetical protein
MKVKIYLEFDQETITTEDLIQYVNELGTDIDFEIVEETSDANYNRI